MNLAMNGRQLPIRKHRREMNNIMELKKQVDVCVVGAGHGLDCSIPCFGCAI